MKTGLQEMRKRAGYKSARAFADTIGMPVRTYTNYEQGTSQLTIENAWRFADALGCSLDDLVGRRYTTPAKRKSETRLVEFLEDGSIRIGRNGEA